jgi:hypothetical protein
MFNNSTNINKTNNFLISYQLFELKKETTTYEVVTEIVRFVDIGGIVKHHHLNFFFINI